VKEGIRRSVLFGVIPKASLHSSQVVDAQIQIAIRGMTRKLVHVPHAHRVVAKVRKVRQQRSEQMERSVRSEGPKRFNDLKPRVEVYLKAILGGLMAPNGSMNMSSILQQTCSSKSTDSIQTQLTLPIN